MTACTYPVSPGSGALRAGAGAFLVLALVLCTCTFLHEPLEGPAPVSLQAQRWPQAEEAFRRDPRWLGGDGAYSVPLGQGRVLWLFGDSFVGDGTSRERAKARVVRNTVAIQKGPDPSSASVSFFWKTRGGHADAFFPDKGERWFWPGSGAMVQGRLLVFLMEISPARGALGFEAAGWAAELIDNPNDDPGAWRASRVHASPNPFSVIVGSACCVVEGDYLYVFGADEGSRGAYLVRFKAGDAARGDLESPEWWAGGPGWVAQASLASRPAPLFLDAQMEFTVHFEPRLGRYVEVQTGGFLDHCLTLRWSRDLTGEWSGRTGFYCPEGTRGLLAYAGKAHPGLMGGDLVCTMALNTLDESRLLGDSSLYYPIFVRCTYGRRGE
jgi:hypothetical protein